MLIMVKLILSILPRLNDHSIALGVNFLRTFFNFILDSQAADFRVVQLDV